MAAKLKKFGDVWRFICPGCGTSHPVDSRWGFNGDVEKPTFSPSLRVYGGRQAEFTQCHSFIRDGMIEFLSDCRHELAGKRVEIPDWDDSRF